MDVSALSVLLLARALHSLEFIYFVIYPFITSFYTFIICLLLGITNTYY